VTDISYLETHQRSRTRAGDESTENTRISVTRPLFELPPPRIPHPEKGWLPDWLAAEIHAAHPNSFRTLAVWTRCARCAAIILTGLDDPVVAASASVDPSPLTPTGELVCALENRKTYRLHHFGTTARIQARDKYQPPAGTKNKPPIVPAHRCDHRFPGFTIQPAPERPANDNPPF
jgi:hypothetical protein